MSICRECPSPLPPDPPGLHPASRRVLCDGCRRTARRAARRATKGPLPAPVKRERRPGPEKLPGTRLSRITQRRRDYIESLKAGRPCHDCGRSFPSFCMDFDHRPTEPKIREVSRCKTKTQVDAEVDTCDLVCACCHRIRTEERRLAGTASGITGPV